MINPEIVNKQVYIGESNDNLTSGKEYEIFGLELEPDLFSTYYNDCDFYNVIDDSGNLIKVSQGQFINKSSRSLEISEEDSDKIICKLQSKLNELAIATDKIFQVVDDLFKIIETVKK